MTLSRRARRLLRAAPMPEYLREHFARAGSVFDPSSNSGGYLPLCVAENGLLAPLLLRRMQSCSDLPARVLGYDAMVGSLDFRERLARFLGRTVFGRTFPAEQLAVLAGAGSVLEILFHQLADPGDAVLVPTPSYAGFWLDLETRNELHILPVPTHSRDGFRLTPEQLDRALAGSDRPVKALLFTTPNNPLGTVYSRGEIEEIVEWSRRARLHVIFDEIYALSVFADREFTSCAQIDPELGDSVHIVWAFSKDFGASGLRCGVLVSENEALLEAVDALAYWACCSGHTQYLLGEVISDRGWVDDYLGRNRSALAEAYRRITSALDDEDIRYLPADAGFFLLVDLRRHLAEPTWEAERALWRHLLETTQVSLTPGRACHNLEPGFFRLCFAALPTESVEIGIRRLGQSLREARIARSS